MKKLAIATLFLGMFSVNSASALPFTISMVGDNDYAIFSGTSSSINNILYQNNVGWGDQINAISTLSFDLVGGDDTFYVLGMGGGGPEENISGLINGVNMTDPSVSVSMSSDLSSFLTGYNLSQVAAGTYNVLLEDVQNTLSSLTWSNAALNLNTTQTVIQQGGFGSGFRFDTGTAHLFRFNSEAVNVSSTPVSEPSTFAIFGLALAGLAFRVRQKAKKK